MGYLAEDRILGFEVLARPGKKWLMAYVKGAIARTDVPMTLVDLIKQRRRWLNGSFFAGVYAIINFWRVWRDSAHSFPRKLLLTVQFFYLTLNNILSWFLVGNLFLGFYYVLSVFLNSRSEAALQAIMMFYVLLVGGGIISGCDSHGWIWSSNMFCDKLRTFIGNHRCHRCHFLLCDDSWGIRCIPFYTYVLCVAADLHQYFGHICVQ